MSLRSAASSDARDILISQAKKTRVNISSRNS